MPTYSTSTALSRARTATPARTTRPVNTGPSLNTFAQPANPPAGYYDPVIDYNERQAQHTYDYALYDLGTGSTDRQQAYEVQRAGLQAQLAAEQGAAAADRSAQEARVALGERYADEDFSRGSRINDEDLARNIEELGRRYQFLGHQQEQRARQMGVASGGALTQSLARRTENQAHDREPIQLGHDRQAEALGIGQRRAHESAGVDRAAIAAAASGRTAGLQAQIDAQIGAALLDLNRGDRDAQEAARRALDQLTDVRLLAGQQRWQQNAALGPDRYIYTPPVTGVRRTSTPATVWPSISSINPNTRSPYAPGGRYGGMLGFPSTYR